MTTNQRCKHQKYPQFKYLIEFDFIVTRNQNSMLDMKAINIFLTIVIDFEIRFV